MSLITISLGSNINPSENLKKALDEISKFSKIKIISKIYKSKSVGFEGDDFLNQVIVCEVNSNLNQTYLQLKTIEKEMGRERNIEKFSDRLIDLDLLTFNDEIHNEEITIPHPDILKYAFVLVPLAEICPKLIHPAANKSVEELLRENNSFYNEVTVSD